MNTADWLMISAVLLAPLIALQVQKTLGLMREKRARKMTIFQTLMATRAARISPSHVQALNMIDIEFFGRKIIGIQWQSRKEKAVQEAWKVYLDNLNNAPKKEELKNWLEKGDDLFVDLLQKMAVSLGYHFDPVHLKRGIYSPKGHLLMEDDQRTIRESLAQILSGKKTIPIKVSSYPPLDEALNIAKKQSEQNTPSTGAKNTSEPPVAAET